jgi:hypothetical protein
MIYRIFVVVMLVLFAYALGSVTGYAVGHNDKMVVEIAKYRALKYKNGR